MMRASRGWAMGGVAVEAALIVPLITILLIGGLEVGRASFGYSLLTQAVREGARKAAVTPSLRPNDPGILAGIDTTLRRGGLQAAEGTVTFTSPLQSGRLIRVSAVVRFRPVLAAVFPKRDSLTVPLRAEVVTRYE